MKKIYEGEFGKLKFTNGDVVPVEKFELNIHSDKLVVNVRIIRFEKPLKGIAVLVDGGNIRTVPIKADSDAICVAMGSRITMEQTFRNRQSSGMFPTEWTMEMYPHLPGAEVEAWEQAIESDEEAIGPYSDWLEERGAFFRAEEIRNQEKLCTL